MEAFEVHAEKQGSSMVFTLKGDITSNSEEALLGAYEKISQEDRKRVVFDLSACNYVNSSGIATFITILHETKAVEGRISLVGLSSHLKKVFQTVGLTKFITMYDSLKQALR